MSQLLKELFVVLALCAPVWYLARRLFVPQTAADVFDRRRNVWLVLTVVGLISPSFWLYCLVAAPLLFWIARRDPNPAALFLLMFYAVPHIALPVPPIIVNELFNLSHFRLLVFVVLVPAALRVSGQRRQARTGGLDLMDTLLLLLTCVVIGLFIPYESATNSLRRLFLFGVDTLVVFYVFSRLGPGTDAIKGCLSAWLLAGMLMAPVAVFEALRSWLLFVPIGERWGAPNSFAFLLRGDRLRAQASTGHALALGYWLAMAWGFFLVLRRDWPQRWARYGVGVLVLGGLWASLSRGPWLTAVVLTIVYLLLDPKGAGSAVKALAGLSLAAALLLLSPVGDRIIDYLPFVGTVDSYNVDYRQQLFEMAWPLILQNPLGGNPDVMLNLESLRQGQGIVDLVNGYIFMALFYGLGGLALFTALLMTAAWRPLTVWARSKIASPDTAYLAAVLVAAILATMFYIATAGYDHTTYILAGLCASCWRIAARAPAPVEIMASARSATTV